MTQQIAAYCVLATLLLGMLWMSALSLGWRLAIKVWLAAIGVTAFLCFGSYLAGFK